MSMSSIPENVATLHREVQRKFGRNLLRLQHEKLMKSFIAEQEVSGRGSAMFATFLGFFFYVSRRARRPLPFLQPGFFGLKYL